MTQHLLRTAMSAFTLCFACSAVAEGAGTQPADQAAAPSEAITWLDRIEHAADQLDTLSADVRWTMENELLGDRQIHRGTLRYRSEPSAFNVRFTEQLVDRRRTQTDQAWVFDGRWLAEKDADERLFTRYELRPEGERATLDDLDGGPFILPLDLSKDRVLKRFNVEVVPLDATAPEQAAVHLQLTPREPEQAKVTRMDIWFEQRHLLPVRVVTLDDEAGERSAFVLSNLQPNVELEGEPFDTSAPTGGGWRVEARLLSDGPEQR